MALVGMEAVSPWLHIGTNLLVGHVACVRWRRSKKLMVMGFTPRRMILPFSAEEPLAVCTKRTSTFFAALPCGWATSDLEVSLEGVVGKQTIPTTNQANDQARGSSTTGTWSRSSSSAVTLLDAQVCRTLNMPEGCEPNWPRSSTEHTRRMIRGLAYSQLPKADCFK